MVCSEVGFRFRLGLLGGFGLAPNAVNVMLATYERFSDYG